MGLNQMAVTRDELTAIAKELFAACDKDGSGFLEKGELRQVAGQIHAKVTEGKADAKPFNEEKFEKGFAMLDKNARSTPRSPRARPTPSPSTRRNSRRASPCSTRTPDPRQGHRGQGRRQALQRGEIREGLRHARQER